MPFDGTGVSDSTAVLLGAIDILEERGWCQGTVSKLDGRVCLVGALQLASKRLGFKTLAPFYHSIHRLQNAIGSAFIGAYNDSLPLETGRVEIVDLLYRTVIK